MRLINTRTLQIEEFVSSRAPKYAILSHTWGEAEATFAQWRSRLTRLRKAKKPGFAKILATCEQARRDDIGYVWVDTACIDKESSAELSEAINSMFAWYERAVVCYVYLADIPDEPPEGIGRLELMGSSKWFSRGWTLQELIAPDRVVFFSQSWQMLGTKKANSSFLSDVTGIDALCLRDREQKPLRRYSIAQRMSWAADRATTRPEDMAYCLLGIFDIHLSPIYGEGMKAFIRLQEEIIRTSGDHSFLAFDTRQSQNSLLADHPDLFRNMRNIQPLLSLTLTPKFSLRNAGLSIRTPLIQTLSPYWVIAVLNCAETQSKRGAARSRICVPLLGKDGVYMRAREPVSLIRSLLSAVYTRGFKEKIEDLTTPKQTKYLISHFTRVYPIFSHDSDFGEEKFDEVKRRSGFLLTFPRGMGNYQLVDAFPSEALRRSTSFFNPHNQEDGIAHGLLVYQAAAGGQGASEASRIGVHLAHTLDRGGSQWMCVLVDIPAEMKQHEYLDQWRASWPFYQDPGPWEHYEHRDNFIVAGRTKFALNDSNRQAVMVEMVFDAETLLKEQGLDKVLANGEGNGSVSGTI
ncbi:hypothetical protein M406DRAFT_69261 [Cryphonectria parasitica EP155]|uniref:Heterokaryon incompatibility domain-containing protein n=1 Tax=Cryphonectria parasitica (strain ATCC 38755 / EP155) TaxID=660469 RepID=A0A9P4Y5X6_CRYP1|nr:uncharacterized protein M406DRAFT_69261 [Cryphonectria parasitica EP155]KAF3767095.1 hypothetical protein M406DRAFT_69261 [Cryphonectria parasitica EP155]